MNPGARSLVPVHLLAATLLCPGSPAAGGDAPKLRTRASLVAETDAVRPGEPLLVGIRLEMDEGWHTYWKNPGDSGLPTRAAWRLPDGFVAGEIRWPVPARFSTGPLVSYGYEREVLLPVEIRVPPAVAAREVGIAARVDWLECLEICIPGRAEVALTLPVRATTSPGPRAALFAEARRRLPASDPAWRVSARPGPEAFDLDLRGPRGVVPREAYFFPARPGLIDHARPQRLARAGPAFRLSVPRDANGGAPDRLVGVLAAETASGRVALEVDVPLGRGPARTSRDKESTP